MDVTYDKSVSPVSELAHAYTDFFLDREDKGFVHSDDELIVATVRLDAPNRKYWHCLTYDQIYSKFYRLFNMVIRSARFWNLFGYVDVYRRGLIYDLMEASDNYWNEFARRQLHDYYEFLDKYLKELTAYNRQSCVDKVKHKEFNDLSGLLLNT